MRQAHLSPDLRIALSDILSPWLTLNDKIETIFGRPGRNRTRFATFGGLLVPQNADLYFGDKEGDEFSQM